MASIKVTVVLAAVLLCAGGVRCESSYTGQSGDTKQLAQNQLAVSDLLSSLLRGAQKQGDGDSSSDSSTTKTREIAPGTTETVTTSIAPDGTRTVSTTRTFTGAFNPSRTGISGAPGSSGQPAGFTFDFTNPEQGAWDPWAFLGRPGFGFSEPKEGPKKAPKKSPKKNSKKGSRRGSRKGPKKAPKRPAENEEIAESPYREDVKDVDIVDIETIGVETQEDTVACSSVETSIEAVERCINAVRQNPAAYYSLLPCKIPEYSPRPPLKVDPALTTSAGKHAIDMAVSKSVTHTGSDGSSMGDRIWKRAKFNGSPIAENVAGGQRSARQVVFGWMCSSGHRKNIMSCSYDSMGTGIQQNGWIYWAQNFGCTKYNRCSC